MSTPKRPERTPPKDTAPPEDAGGEGLWSTRLLRMGAALLVCLVVAAAPLAAGGTRVEAKLLLAVPALAALLLLAFERTLGPPADRGLRLPWMLWPPIVVAGLIALQLVPIPLNLLAFLSPAAAELRADLPHAGQAAPLSLDPAATAVGLTLQVAFVAVLVTAFNSRRPRQAWVLHTLAATGALVALIGFAHWATGATTLYGVYPLRHIDRLTGFFATFVNNNTLAGFEVLAGLTTLGLFARADEARLRALLLLGVLLCFAAALLAGSRGGHVALVVGLVLFTLFAHGGHGAEAWRGRARLAAWAGLALAGLGLGAALVVLPEWNVETLAHLDDDAKVAGWPAAIEMAKAFWITGSGRDSFIFVHPAWQALSLPGSVSHPENHLLQLACELGVGGLVVGIGGGLLMAASLLPGIARRGSPTDWGVVAGILACGAQQLVDFGLESAGLALPVAAALGVALARAHRRRGPPQGAARSLKAAWGAVAGSFLALGSLAALDPALRTSQADVVLRTLAQAPPAQRDALLAAHPADPFFALTLAQHHFEVGAPLAEILGWINRAQRRFPQSHRPHLLAARVLVAAKRPAQAAVEFRLAIERAPWLDTVLAAEAVAGLSLPRHLLAALPDTPRGRTLLANALANAERHTHLRETMEELELLAPDDAERRRFRAEACLAQNDLSCTEAEATWLMNHGHAGLAWPLRARLAAHRGDGPAADTALDALGPLEARTTDGLALTARVHSRLGRPTEALAALDLLERRVPTDPVRRAEIHVLRARIQARHGPPEAALDSLVRALALHPDPRTAAAAVRQARTLGRDAEARRLLDSARRRWPKDAGLRALDTP